MDTRHLIAQLLSTNAVGLGQRLGRNLPRLLSGSLSEESAVRRLQQSQTLRKLRCPNREGSQDHGWRMRWRFHPALRIGSIRTVDADHFRPFQTPPTPYGQRPIAVLSLGFSQAAVNHERREITHALEFRIRIHPVDIGLPDFIGLAIHDENLSGRNLFDVAVKCRTDG